MTALEEGYLLQLRRMLATQAAPSSHKSCCTG
jgi:hypothetical protein